MKAQLRAAIVLLLTACGGDRERPEPRGGSEGAETSEGAGAAGTGTTEGTEVASAGLVVSDDACTSDADCVPAGCCHPAACTGIVHAVSCQDVMCTSECRYGTLDCGGSCLCHEGRCAARLSGPPAGVGELPPPS